MKKKTFRKMLRALVSAGNDSGAKLSRSHTKRGPGRMPHSRSACGRQRLAPYHGPGTMMELDQGVIRAIAEGQPDARATAEFRLRVAQ